MSRGWSGAYDKARELIRAGAFKVTLSDKRLAVRDELDAGFVQLVERLCEMKEDGAP